MNEKQAGWNRLAVAGIVALFAVAAYGYTSLPETIATNFHADGTIGYGSKLVLWLLPALGLFGFWMVAIAEKRDPFAAINVPFKPRRTPENEAALRAQAQLMLVMTRATLAIGFTAVESQVIASARGSLSPAFLPVIAVLIIALIGVQIVGVRRLRMLA